ncbi:Protein ELYS, partial [Sciurus carolinensis]|nr:Protein ELYS [Sciurus carolinensis]
SMRDLTAQVTSGLLQFPEVTIQALREDEITLESVLHGRFAAGKNGLACLACGPQLEVVNSITGERLSAYRFTGVNQQPPVVLAVKDFSWQKRSGLLIGLEEAEGSVLCLYDLGVSRVVKAVVLPGRVTAIEPIINHGGASASSQHLHPSLRWLFGVAAVVTDIGHILLIDLCLDDVSCSQSEVEALDLEVITGIPAEVPHIRESVMREGRHLCFQLVSPSGTAVSTLTYISRTNHLAVGFSDGYLALWNMKSMKREYYTQLEGGRIPVYAITFQEPENDPRNCCYLWAVQSTQDSEGDVLSLHLLQLAFGDRKCLASGQTLYEGLEYCEERYTLDLAGGIFPLRGHTSNTKLLGCQSIEKFRSHGDREENMSEDATCLLNSGIVHISCTGFQKETLTFLKKSGQSLNEVIPDGYNRCLIAGFLSPRLVDTQPSSLSQEEQLEAVLSAAIQTSSLGLLTGCIRSWITEDDAVQLSRLCYNYPVIQNYYTSRRQKCERLSRGKWNHDCLMIDGLVSQLGDQVEKLWKRDEGGTGKYPPASLHTIYLLLDIMYSFPNKTDTPIESFPTAFAISWGQIKLIQGFWLIDHNDYESGLDLLFHPATAKPLSWQHSKIIQAFMSQGEYRQALRYIQTMKPTVSSGSDVILHLTVLLFNRCLVEAWSLLRQHSNKVNVEELLKHAYEVCQEMGLMEDLLKLPFTDTEQECLVKFLQSSASVQNHEFLLVHHLQRANYIPALKLNQTLKINLMNDRDPRLRERSVARNSILEQYGKILPRVQRKLAMERAKPYHLSTTSVFREFSRPKPLSAFPKKAMTGTVLSRSTFINNVLSRIGEVWTSNDPRNSISLYNRSGLRTPLVSPSTSPGRSLTPPLRLKETRISFMEEDVNTKWTTTATDNSNTEAFITTPFHKCGVPAETEWPKSKDETSSFLLSNSEKDLQEMDTGSQDASSPSLEKLDVSKESNASTGSDQTTLEYQDAPLPEEFEEIFLSSQSGNSSTELNTNLTEQIKKDEDKDVFELEVVPSDEGKQMGTLKVAKESLSGLNHLSATEGVEASLCVPSVQEGKIPMVPILDEGLIAVETYNSTIRADNNESVASDLGDSGNCGLIISESPVISEHTLKEDHGIEIGVLKESVDIPEEKPPISDSSSDTQEIHVTGHEKLEVQNSGEEARNLSFNELYPSGTLKLQYNFDAIEQQFCDLPNNKDSAECDIAEVDGELFVAQSNFTLILEGEEGEVETGDSATSNVLPKVVNATTKEKLVYSVEHDDRGHVSDFPSIITSDQESQKVETLPYVPEPIKVAIAENLLDVIKDTRSKDITSDVIEQSIHESVPLISQKVMCSTKLVKPAIKTVQETSTMTINVSQGDDMVSSRTRMRKRVQNLNITTAGQESADVATPKMLGPQSVKKTRKAKEISEVSESAYSDIKGISQNQQIPQNSIISRRGRKKKETNPDALESIDSVEQELEVISGRKLKKLKSSQLIKSATEEISFRKEVKLSSVTKRTPRRTRKSVENQESAEIIKDLKVSKVASLSGTVKKLRKADREASENIQEGKSSDQQLPVKRSRRIREKEITMLDVIEESKLDSSQLILQAEIDLPATPRKRGRPRKINPSENVGSKTVKEDKSPKKRVLSIRRSVRNTPARNENIDDGKPVFEKSILVPSEELVMTNSKKKLTKKTKNQNQKCSLHPVSDEMTHKQTNDQEERLLATSTFTKSSRSTRTRSSKAILLPDLSEPKSEPLFSPPAAEVPRKVKAEKIEAPTQLKELVSDLSSQFVFSPPALRTRRKNISGASKVIDELKDDAKSGETVGEQKVKRIRTTKRKQASKNTEEESSWSPPPIKIKLISPLASPVEGVKSKPRKTAEVKGNTLGRGRKKPSSFPKQVLRRKML